MATHSLKWSRIILCTTVFHASIDKESNPPLLQWHTEGSNLYAMMSDRPEIQLRMEREIYDLQV
jgi:hypothetical protein